MSSLYFLVTQFICYGSNVISGLFFFPDQLNFLKPVHFLDQIVFFKTGFSINCLERAFTFGCGLKTGGMKIVFFFGGGGEGVTKKFDKFFLGYIFFH